MQTESSKNTGPTLDDGETCGHSRQSPPNNGKSTSSAAGSRAKTSAAADTSRDSTERDRGFGSSLPASFAYYDRASSSWKTSEILLFEDLQEFSAAWPRSGLMRNGKCYRRPRLARRTEGNGYSLWPTILAGDASCLVKFSAETLRKMPSAKVTTRRNGGAKLCEVLAGHFDAYLDSRFGEWLMGFPETWTELEDAETQ